MQNIYYHARRTLTRFSLAAVVLVTALAPLMVHAESTTVRISRETIQRGFTASSAESEFRIAVWPNLVAEPVTIRLEEVSSPALPVPEGMTRVSDVWEFDMLNAEAATNAPLKVLRPLTLSLRFSSETLYRKRMMYWDRNKQRWQAIPTTVQDGATAVGRLRLPYAQVAVFEDTTAVEGRASWFRHRQGNAAASNDFPMGSTLRVTNTETNKATTVIVRSSGPFVPGRVVDLASVAFKRIQPLWRGVANVRVELID